MFTMAKFDLKSRFFYETKTLSRSHELPLIYNVSEIKSTLSSLFTNLIGFYRYSVLQFCRVASYFVVLPWPEVRGQGGGDANVKRDVNKNVVFPTGFGQGS